VKFSSTFFKRWQVKGGALVAIRRWRNTPPFFAAQLVARLFFFAPFVAKEKSE